MIYDLKCLEIGSVMKDDESKCFGTTDAADPASYCHFLVHILFSVFVNFSYSCKLHNLFPLCLSFLIQLISSIDYSSDSCKE